MKLPKKLNLPNPGELSDTVKPEVKDHLRRVNDELQKDHQQIYDTLLNFETRIVALEP
ncbi:MAG: hypothetical protein PHH26_00655 [Candidatus Thermoplasmatota archaeon]|nr:hypothetical protein [Candidatus Thermoplasmatota archaeon]